MHHVIENLNWRYATKKFDPTKKVSKEDLLILQESARLTATSYGMQAMQLYFISDQTLKNELFKHSYNQSQVKDASNVIVIANKTRVEESDIDQYLSLISETRDVPLQSTQDFGKSIKMDLLNRENEQINIWSKNQCYIVMGNLLNTCAQLRIDSCPMEGFLPDKYNEVLGLDKKHLNTCLVLPIGYRSEDDIFQNFKKVRRSNQDIITLLD